MKPLRRAGRYAISVRSTRAGMASTRSRRFICLKLANSLASSKQDGTKESNPNDQEYRFAEGGFRTGTHSFGPQAQIHEYMVATGIGSGHLCGVRHRISVGAKCCP